MKLLMGRMLGNCIGLIRQQKPGRGPAVFPGSKLVESSHKEWPEQTGWASAHDEHIIGDLVSEKYAHESLVKKGSLQNCDCRRAAEGFEISSTLNLLLLQNTFAPAWCQQRVTMDKNGDAVPVFNIGQLFPFSIEQVGCHIDREASVDFAYISFGSTEPDAAQVSK
jgi:hypothetical protein